MDKAYASYKPRPRESATGEGAGAFSVADPIHYGGGRAHEDALERGLGQVGVAVS